MRFLLSLVVWIPATAVGTFFRFRLDRRAVALFCLGMLLGRSDAISWQSKQLAFIGPQSSKTGDAAVPTQQPMRQSLPERPTLQFGVGKSRSSRIVAELSSSDESKESCDRTPTENDNHDNVDENKEQSSSAADIALLHMWDNLMLPKDCRVDRMSPTDLAYLGDVVYELFIRARMVWPSKRTSDLQNQVVGLVRAEFQAFLLSRMKEDFLFTPEEQRVLSRGRNAVSGSKQRKSNPAAYQDATALEAILGYWYLTDRERCTDAFRWIQKELDDKEAGGK